MTDNNAFERFVADHLADDGSGLAQAERLAARVDERTSERRQWPRWLALIKEPPMRTNSHLAVGSPTVRVVAILVATMLLAVALAAAGAGARQLLASDGAIVVAPDGSGDYTSIEEAVDAAVEGDRVLVKPGVYAETVSIDKTIELLGDGDPGDVVVEVADDGTLHEGEDITGLNLLGNDSVVRNLTVRATGFDFAQEEPAGVTLLAIEEGSPTVDSLVLPGGVVQALALGSTDAVLANLEVHGGVEIYFGAPTIESSQLMCGVRIEGDAILRDNTIRGDGDCVVEPEFGHHLDKDVYITEGSSPTLSGNDISMGGGGIVITQEAISPTLDSNRIHGNDVAVSVAQGSTPTITSNVFVGNDSAVILLGGTELGPNAVIADNTVSGGQNGFLINGGRSELTGNSVEGVAERGIFISGKATPTLRDNSVCGNGTNLEILDTANPDIDDSNEVCED